MQNLKEEKEIKAGDVLDIYTNLENLGVKIWIDGGWAKDALLGEITRSHSDLDIAIEHKNVKKFREFFQQSGYAEIERAEDKKWDFVLSDDKGHEIDVHAFSFDENGEVIEENDWAGYCKKSLTGLGNINGQLVRCVSLEHLIKTHDASKRILREKDFKDMENLKKKFDF